MNIRTCKDELKTRKKHKKKKKKEKIKIFKGIRTKSDIIFLFLKSKPSRLIIIFKKIYK